MFRARAFRKQYPRFESAPRDDRSSKSQPKRVENGRDRSLQSWEFRTLLLPRSHKERNNGALVVRAMPRDGDGALDSSGYAASLGSGSPPVHSSSGAHLAGFGSSSSLGSFGDFGSAGTLQRTWSGASLARTSGASLASLGSFPSSGSLSGDQCGNQPLVWGPPTKLQNSLARSNRSRFG